MTAEAICRTYTRSIITRRWAATWLDLLLFGVLLASLMAALWQNGLPAAFLIWLTILLVYYPLLEGLTGATFGKLVCRLVIVDADGNVPGLWKATQRTLLRLLEVNPFLFGGVPAGFAVFHSPTRQRFGDQIAHTYVIKAEDLPRIGAQPAAEAALPPVSWPLPDAMQSASFRPPLASGSAGDVTSMGFDLPPGAAPSAEAGSTAPPDTYRSPDAQAMLAARPTPQPVLPSYAHAPQFAARVAPHERTARRKWGWLAAAGLLGIASLLYLVAGEREARSHRVKPKPITMSSREFLRASHAPGWYHLTHCQLDLEQALCLVSFRKKSTDETPPAPIEDLPISEVYIPVRVAGDDDDKHQTSLVVLKEDLTTCSLADDLARVSRQDEKSIRAWMDQNFSKVFSERDVTGMIEPSADLSTLSLEQLQKSERKILAPDFMVMKEGEEPTPPFTGFFQGFGGFIGVVALLCCLPLLFSPARTSR